MIKFKSLRHKLLFWFLVFVSSNLIVVAINFTYLSQREKIANVFRLLEQTHGYLLEDYKNQLNFFTQETKNRVFFEFGASQFLDHHKALFEDIDRNLLLLQDDDIIHKFELEDEVRRMAAQLAHYDSLFNSITERIKERGYKDYNLIGEMREAAHALQELSDVSTASLLTMRRHEKDFLLRHENIYIRKLNETAKEIIDQIQRSGLSNDRKAELQGIVERYQQLFKQIVELDKEIGLHNNSGLKAELDKSETIMASQFQDLLAKAEIGRERQFTRLKFVTISVIVGFILFGVWMSFVTSWRITSPLLDLTSYISRFVSSNFTLINDKPKKLTEDEIGKLTLNFNVMREKIVEQLQFFKQKVEERTAELANANERLVKINEANKRFVPSEFLEHLHRESIEEVRLGDFVECKMTIAFSDIRGFTKFSEKMTPQQNFDFINAYLKEIVPHVKEHQGFVDKYIGDSVMALFEYRVEHAIDSSIDSMRSVRRFNEIQKRQNKEPIKVGIGIHTGQLILGTIGEENRMETTVISDAVNTASRVEGLSSIYGGNILISGAVLSEIEDPSQYDIRYIDTVMAKGKEKAIKVYEVLNGLREEQHLLKLKTNSTFQEGITYYKEKNFVSSKNAFEEVIAQNPEDQAAAFYLSNCVKIIKEGIPDDWGDIQKMDSKKGG